jgi:hypothetical protein
MRGYKTLIQEAELMAMPPEAVAEFLRVRAGQSEGETRADPVDKDAEKALQGRDDPLIELALARYGRHIKVVSGIFQESTPGSPVRLACLSNRSMKQEIFQPSFPEGLLGGEPGPIAEWLASASDDELLALFENPALSDSFLRDLLERREGLESIDDDRLCQFVSILHGNPRMQTQREDDWMDGYADYSYGSVLNAAWKLAETVPATEAWATSLAWLYEQLQPNAFSIQDPLSLAARWQIDPADAEATERQAKNREIGNLGNKERVRKGLARLALNNSRELLPDLLASKDLAFRVAAYSSGDLTAEQLQSGYMEDGELVFYEAIRNMALWRSQNTREALRSVAWSVVNADKRGDLLAANLFQSMRKDVRKKHPAWFADEAEVEEPSYDDVDGEAPATKADLAAISSLVEKQSRGLVAISPSLRGLMIRTGWVWWFSLGALVASLRNF